MKKAFVILFVNLFSILLIAQNNKINVNLVDTNRLKSIIDTLTSPTFAGRGLETNNLVTNYLSDYYENIGLKSFYKNGYIQKMHPFKYLKFSDSSYLKINNNQLTIKKDFAHSLFDYKKNFNYTSNEITTELFFAGLPNKDIDNTLANINLKNKTVIFFPKNGVDKSTICYKKGANAVIELYVDDEAYNKVQNYQYLFYQGMAERLIHLYTPNKPTFATIYLSPNASAKLLGIKLSKLKKYAKKYNAISDSLNYKIPSQIKINIHREKEYTKSGNVIGYVQGEDTTGKHIVVSAHYDHIGKNNNFYFPGANDNASGVSSMLEIAKVLSEANKLGFKPKQSIIFISFGLEESGLLGSEFYVENPILPLEKLTANINLDMLGRQDRYHDTIPNYIYALAPDSLSLHIMQLMDSINNIHNFTRLEFLNNYPNAKKFFYRSSDQFNFFKKNIPAVLINNGIIKELHKSSDTKEKLNYQTIENITKLLILSIWELANQP